MGLGWSADEQVEIVELPHEKVFGMHHMLLSVSRFAGAAASHSLTETSTFIRSALSDILVELRRDDPSVYICGGRCAASMTSALRYIPRRVDWDMLPPLGMARKHCALSSVSGRVFVIGGADMRHFSDQNLDDAECRQHILDASSSECFNPASGSWEVIPATNKPCTNAAAATLGGQIYLFGGLSFGEVLNQALRLDPRRDSWEALRPMPMPCFECAAASLRGRILVVGGATLHGSPLDAAQCYCPVENKWTMLPSMTHARYGCAAVAAVGKFFVFGGTHEYGTLSSAESYACESEAWTLLHPMSVNRTHCGAALAAGKVYVMGGHPERLEVDCYDLESQAWDVTATLPHALSYCVAVGALS